MFDGAGDVSHPHNPPFHNDVVFYFLFFLAKSFVWTSPGRAAAASVAVIMNMTVIILRRLPSENISLMSGRTVCFLSA